MSRGTQGHTRSLHSFIYGAFTLYDGPFQVPSTREKICNSFEDTGVPQVALQHPKDVGLQPTKSLRFRLFPFRSPLLRESLLIYFPRGT